MIELKVDDFLEGNVSFHIERQDKEDYKRLINNYCLFEISGVKFLIRSGAFPGFYSEEKQFFVRGTMREEDYTIIRVSLSEYLIIYELIKKYNETCFDFWKLYKI